MIQNETKSTSFTEFFELLSESVAEKVTIRLMPLINQPSGKNVQPEEKPIRGQRALCHIYGMSSATLSRMIKEGKIPYRKIGNRFLFYANEVDQALKGGTA